MTTSTQPLTDRDALLEAVRASDLLTPAQLTKATAAVPPSAETAEQAARALVGAGFLTHFQADRLLSGRTDGFVLGQYVIQEPIGRGPIGRVFRAMHRAMNRPVAIKVIEPELTRTAAARQAFGREVKAAARLNHPNVVTTYDANEVGERSYLVLEFVDGPTLESLVREHGPLPTAQACEFVRQAAWGLQHAHELGMVHRDVKPANLLVAKPSKLAPACVVKIADFGLARLAPADPGGSGGGLVGSPDYLSPEQGHDRALADHRSDLYSLGCVFYFLLTGTPPFPSLSRSETIRRHLFEEPARVDRVRPDVPPSVASVVQRLMAKDSAVRFASAAELATHLECLSAVANGTADAAGLVSFELPRSQPGTHGEVSGGHLTGLGHAATSDTSPWAQLTEETLAPSAATLDGAEPTPVVPRGRPAARSGGVSVAAVVGLCGSILVGCIVAIGVVIRVMAK
jgi:serine/threonine-protein kinase